MEAQTQERGHGGGMKKGLAGASWWHELARWRCYYMGLVFAYGSWLVGYFFQTQELRAPDSPFLGPTFRAVEETLHGLMAHLPATALIGAAFGAGVGMHALQVRGLCPCQLAFRWADEHLFGGAERRRRQLMPFSPYIDELMFQEQASVRESTLFRRLDRWSHKKLGVSGGDALKALIDKLYEAVLADARLAPMFDEPLVSMQWLKHHQYQFLSRLFQQENAETVYTGRSLQAAHSRLAFDKGLKPWHLDCLFEDLAAVMAALDIPRDIQQDAVAVLSKFRPIFEQLADLAERLEADIGSPFCSPTSQEESPVKAGAEENGDRHGDPHLRAPGALDSSSGSEDSDQSQQEDGVGRDSKSSSGGGSGVGTRRPRRSLDRRKSLTSKSTINHLSEEYECLTVLFADMVAFTKLCRNQEPRMIMHMLNDLFESFDAMLPLFDVEKIETVGDCYVLVGGMTGSRAGLTEEQRREEDRIGVRNVLNMAKAMIATAKGLRRIDDGAPIQLRIGIHSGPCVSGVIGIEKPRLCLFGDTINVASRMESTGAAGRIHVSKQTAELVPEYRWEPVPLHIKGKGEMETFFTQDVLTPRTSLAPIDG